MTLIDGPATLSRRLARVLATARRARRSLHVPLVPPADAPIHIDGDRLFAYWENALDADARREVEEHACGCEECRRWLEEIGKMFCS